MAVSKVPPWNALGLCLVPVPLVFFSITDKGIFRLWSRFFPIDNGFFTYNVIGEADEGKW